MTVVRKRGAANAWSKTVGHTERVAAEFAALGLLSGILAAVGAVSLAWVIATQLFNLEFVPDPVLWVVGIVLGASIVGISGTLAVRSVINSSPVAVLRGN